MKVFQKSIFLIVKMLFLSSIVIFSSYAQSISQLEKDLHLNCKYEKSKSLKDGSLERTGGSNLLIVNFLKNSAVSLVNDKNGQIFLGSFSKTEINVESRGNINSSPETSESYTINRFTGEFENTFRVVGYDKTISGWVHSGICSKVEKRF